MNFDTRGLTVMIAEHDRTILELLQIRLDVAGYNTCMARNGVMALETLQLFRPAVLIMDLNLPELSGLEVLKALCPKGGKPPFPTLIMGARLSGEDVQKAIAVGARDCISKPFSGADVIDRVARLLRRSPPKPMAPIRLAC